MKHFVATIAWRYAIGFGKNRILSTMVTICVLALCIGSFSMALVMAIMNGLEQATYQQLRTIHPSLIMRSNGKQLNVKKISSVLTQEFPEIVSFSPVGFEYALLNNCNTTSTHTIAAIKGVDPLAESTTNSIEKHIRNINNTAHITLPKMLTPNNSVVIGEQMATDLNIKIGDPLTILIADPDEETMHNITLSKQILYVTGLFKTGIDEFDSNLAYVSLSLFATLFPNAGIIQIDLQTQPQTNKQQVIKKLSKRFHLRVYSWQDLYPSLVSAIKLEQYALFLIFALITLVASMNIISLLFMYITHKKKDIAILRTIGFKNSHIKRLFFYLGMGISIISAIIGLTTAMGVSYLLDKYKIISLPPESYYVSHLPAKMELSILVTVFIIVIGIGILATLVASRRAINSKIIQSLHGQ